MNRNECIIRLSRYRKSLQRLLALGFVRVFSDNLADSTGVTPAQVRKDFSLFGISGNRKGGYAITDLLKKLDQILGRDKVRNMVVVGTGNMGTALLKYQGFAREGYVIVAGFDIKKDKQSPEGNPRILPMEDLAEVVKNQNVRIGIIAVPDYAAQQALEKLVEAGIYGVLNFAPIKLSAKEGIIIRNVNLESELDLVSYFVAVMDRAGGGLLHENLNLDETDEA